jgi:hypothetical protein
LFSAILKDLAPLSLFCRVFAMAAAAAHPNAIPNVTEACMPIAEDFAGNIPFAIIGESEE